MNNFTIEQINIGMKIIDRITDEDGTHWYPLTAFLNSVLCKRDQVSSYRDSALVRYMKVFEYTSPKRGAQRPIKTWCMNENGIKYILRHMKIIKNNNNIKLYKARERGLWEACTYFNVKPLHFLAPTFVKEYPKLNNYDVWSKICLENDFKITDRTTWKLCAKCGFYYPDNSRYYPIDKHYNTKPNCKQCSKSDFTCSNNVIQYIYEHNGLNLLYAIEMESVDKVVEELHKFIDKGGVVNNDN